MRYARYYLLFVAVIITITSCKKKAYTYTCKCYVGIASTPEVFKISDQKNAAAECAAHNGDPYLPDISDEGCHLQ